MPISPPSSPNACGVITPRDTSFRSHPFLGPGPFTKRRLSDAEAGAGSASAVHTDARGTGDIDSDVESSPPPRKFGPAAVRTSQVQAKMPVQVQATPVRPPQRRHNAISNDDDLARAARFRQSIGATQLHAETVWLMRKCVEAGVKRAGDLAIVARQFGTHTGAYRTTSLRVFWADYKRTWSSCGPGTRPSSIPEDFDFASLALRNGSWIENRLLAELLGRHPESTVDEFVALALPQVHEMREIDIRNWYHGELRPGHYPHVPTPAPAAGLYPQLPVIDLDVRPTDHDDEADSLHLRASTPPPRAATQDDPLDLSLPTRRDA